jgi:hypothetical protein
MPDGESRLYAPPPAVWTAGIVGVKVAVARRRKVMVRLKKTLLRATEERREAMNIIKVNIIQPKRKKPMADSNSAASLSECEGQRLEVARCARANRQEAAMPDQGETMRAKLIQKPFRMVDQTLA